MEAPDKPPMRPGAYGYAVRQNLFLDDPLLADRLGTLIREARSLAGWTQEELGIRAAVAQPRISRLERGVDADPDIAVVARLLSAMGIRGSLELSDRALDDPQSGDRQAMLAH